MKIPCNLGERIRFFRKLRKLTQAMLAHLINVSRQLIVKYERGQAVPPASRIPALCAALRITSSQLFDEPLPTALPRGPMLTTKQEIIHRYLESYRR